MNTQFGSLRLHFFVPNQIMKKKISSLILLQFAINLVESFLLTSLVLKEARICFDF